MNSEQPKLEATPRNTGSGGISNEAFDRDSDQQVPHKKRCNDILYTNVLTFILIVIERDPWNMSFAYDLTQMSPRILTRTACQP